MKPAKIFIAFTLLLASAFQVPAQDISISFPSEEEFSELLKLGPKKIKNLELGFSTPNELDEYKFFAEGKLKGLKLGISTKDDIKKIFGKDCEDICEYDANWRVVFTYFENISKEITENGIKKKIVADAQSADKIYSVKLVPKNRISLTDVKFPEVFYKGRSVAFGHDFSGNAAGISSDVYTDSYGLKYWIFDAETYSTFKEKDNRQNGDLISIEYTIPNNLEDKMFVEKQK